MKFDGGLLKFYLGKPGNMEECEVISIAGATIVTNKGVYTVFGSWEGLALEYLEAEGKYDIVETDDGLSIIEK